MDAISKNGWYTCSECGRSIKNPYQYLGKVYGSECINKVTGMNNQDLTIISNKFDYNVEQYLEWKKNKIEKAKKEAEDYKVSVENMNNLMKSQKEFADKNRSTFFWLADYLDKFDSYVYKQTALIIRNGVFSNMSLSVIDLVYQYDNTSVYQNEFYISPKIFSWITKKWLSQFPKKEREAEKVKFYERCNIPEGYCFFEE